MVLRRAASLADHTLDVTPSSWWNKIARLVTRPIRNDWRRKWWRHLVHSTYKLTSTHEYVSGIVLRNTLTICLICRKLQDLHTKSAHYIHQPTMNGLKNDKCRKRQHNDKCRKRQHFLLKHGGRTWYHRVWESGKWRTKQRTRIGLWIQGKKVLRNWKIRKVDGEMSTSSTISFSVNIMKLK